MSTDLAIVLSGLINSGLVELAKRAQSLPIWPHETGKLRTLAMVLSVITTLVTALASGTLGTDEGVAGLIKLVADAGASWLVAHMTYQSFFKKADNA